MMWLSLKLQGRRNCGVLACSANLPIPGGPDNGTKRPMAETVGHVAKALELARETGDRQLTDNKTFGLGFSLLWFGDLEAADEHLKAALQQAERTGNIPLQDRCLAYLSIACHLKGYEGQARTYMEQGLEAATNEENTHYIGVAKANLAWLSYRDGRLDEAVGAGLAALEQWRLFAYPLEWLARWPLMAVSLLRGQMSQAIDHVRAMLEPAQQRPSDDLEALLAEAIKAWDEGQAGSARERLKRAMDLASEMGYL
jgi:tetratricopeptide (TPR) repeat protein